jgi:4-aminobutyrate aminotransferase
VYLTPFPDVHLTGDDQSQRATDEALAALRDVLARRIPAASVAAMLIEPVQGEGGVNPAPVAFLQGLRSICDESGALLVVDEVQTGLARTGWMWAFEAAGVVPDAVCVGKAIANGLPLAALVASRELHDRWGRGAHGSTFGGNPVACAAGVAVLDTIAEEDLVVNAAVRGAGLSAGLRALRATDNRIGDIRGPGLMIGAEMVRTDSGQPDGDLANALIARCADLGLLLLTAGTDHEVVRWLPPLDVTAAEVEEGLGIFRQALADVG